MFFEDFAPGQIYQTDSKTITEDEIIGFAQQWDRQFFHLDKEAAEQSMYGGLIASGFHTLLITFDLTVRSAIWTESSRGSPGMEEVRWRLPVRPGDTLRAEQEVIRSTPSTTRGDRGYVLWEIRTFNQADDMVMSYRSTGICLRRTPLDMPDNA